MQVKSDKKKLKNEVETWMEYKRVHRNYIRAYKKLHAEVAAFSILPEQFISEAEPVIERYLENFASGTNSARQRQQLQVITGFINRFHELMDEATAMLSQHKKLADSTFSYLKKVVSMEALQQCKTGTKAGADYSRLLPELERLRTDLKEVKQTAACTTKHMNTLTPIWKRIKGQLS